MRIQIHGKLSRRPFSLGATIAFLLVAASSLTAQSAEPARVLVRVQSAERPSDQLIVEGRYDRPSLTLVPVSLRSRMEAGYNALCSDGCAALPIGSRFDMNQLSSLGEIPSMREVWDIEGDAFADGAGEEIRNILARGGAGRNTLLHLYEAEDDFAWSTNRLAARAMYGVTTSDAITTIASERGVTGDNASELVANTYFLVFSAVDYEESRETVDLPLGGTMETIQGSVKPIGALFRIGYQSRAEVMSALVPFYCGSTAADCGGANDLEAERARRRAAFEQFVPEITLVSLFEAAVVSESANSREEGDIFELLGVRLAATTLDALLDEMVRAEPSLRVRTAVVETGPVAARIGRKEGVKRGRRYFAFEMIEDANGEVELRRSGVVRAADVADNRVTAVVGASGEQQTLTATDSTLFKQIQGGEIRRFHTLEERPDLGVSILAGASVDGGGGGWARIEYLMTAAPGGFGEVWPLGLKLFFEAAGAPSAQPVPESDQDLFDGAYWRANIGLANEFYLGRGNLRFGLEASVGLLNNTTIDLDTDETLNWSARHARVGGTLAYAFSPLVDLVFAANYAVTGGMTRTYSNSSSEEKQTFSTKWSEFLDTGSGLGFGLGLRFAF